MPDRRRKKTILDLWNTSYGLKIILVMIPVLAGSVLGWGAWVTLSVGSESEIYSTKKECRLSTKTLESRIDKKLQHDADEIQKLQEQIFKNTMLLQRIDERTRKIYIKQKNGY